MKIENQVCTLEQAKKFEQLGITAQSVFYWHFDSGMKWQLLPWGFFNPESEGVDYYPAYNIAELGLVLPHNYTVVKNQVHHLDWWCQKILDNGMLEDLLQPHPESSKEFGDGFKTEAEARAEMLIYLLENNLITSETVNAKLK